MTDWMDPPWAIDPTPWQGERWILTQSDYLDRWRNWFCSLNRNEREAYRTKNEPPSASAQFYLVFGEPKYDPALAAEQHRDGDGKLVPPWIAYPQIPLGSIGWRMGMSEDYWHEFAGWYRRLQPRHRQAFRAKYPEPAEVEQGYPWTGFYDRLEA